MQRSLIPYRQTEFAHLGQKIYLKNDGSITVTVSDDVGNVIWSKTTAPDSSAPSAHTGKSVNILT